MAKIVALPLDITCINPLNNFTMQLRKVFIGLHDDKYYVPPNTATDARRRDSARWQKFFLCFWVPYHTILPCINSNIWHYFNFCPQIMRWRHTIFGTLFAMRMSCLVQQMAKIRNNSAIIFWISPDCFLAQNFFLFTMLCIWQMSKTNTTIVNFTRYWVQNFSTKSLKLQSKHFVSFSFVLNFLKNLQAQCVYDVSFSKDQMTAEKIPQLNLLARMKQVIDDPTTAVYGTVQYLITFPTYFFVRVIENLHKILKSEIKIIIFFIIFWNSLIYFAICVSFD